MLFTQCTVQLSMSVHCLCCRLQSQTSVHLTSVQHAANSKIENVVAKLFQDKQHCLNEICSPMQQYGCLVSL